MHRQNLLPPTTAIFQLRSPSGFSFSAITPFPETGHATLSVEPDSVLSKGFAKALSESPEEGDVQTA
jgi:hypothetical protein